MGLRVASILLVASVVGGCGLAATPLPSEWPVRTPYPLPPGATTVPLETEPPASPYPPGVAWACAAVLLGPVRIAWDRAAGSVRFVSTDTGASGQLVWPRGFAAWIIGDRLEIVDPSGNVIGRDGDVLSTLGGGTHVCAAGGTLYEPAR